MTTNPLRASSRIALGTLLSRVTGLVRVGATAAVLDIGALTDVYNSANSTPNLIYELLLGGVLTATLVPLFVDLGARDDRRGTQAVMGVVGTTLIALSALAAVAAPLIARLLAAQVDPAMHGDAVALGTSLIRCFAVQILGYGFVAMASAALNAHRRFAAAAFAPILNNVVVTAVLVLAAQSASLDQPGDLALDAVERNRSLTLLLGFGTSAGVIATALALVVPLWRAGIPLRPRWLPRDPAVSRLVRASGWTLGYVVANQVALLFVMVIARDTPGALSAYQFAFVFFQLPHGLIAVSIMTAWLPDLVAQARANDLGSFAARFDDGLRSMMLFIVPAAGGYLALSLPIVDSLLTVGASSPTATAAALTGFAVGLIPFSAYLFALRGFYALNDTRTPFVINAGENALNIVFAAFGFARYGVRGLALGYSAAYAIAAIVALITLRRRLGVSSYRMPGRHGIAVMVGGIACCAAASAGSRSVDAPGVALVIGGFAGAGVYGLIVATTSRAEIRRLVGGAGVTRSTANAEPPTEAFGV